MNRIESLFKQKKSGILSVFFTAGFPTRDATPIIAAGLEKAGVDIIEIGIPFSDPVADGPVIQQSNKVALDNGMTLKLLLEQVRTIRKTVKLPILLMGYLNPVLQYGVKEFCREAADAGVDGLILPDLPLAEYEEEYRQHFQEHGLVNVFLVSPTTSDDRIRTIDRLSEGFIYAVSASSTTGARTEFSAEQERYFTRLKELKLTNPFLIGFGISNQSTYDAACRHGAGAIVGSAFIHWLRESKASDFDILSFVRTLRNA